MVMRGFVGRTPAPFEERRGKTTSRWTTPTSPGARPRRSTSALGGSPYTVVERVEETARAVSLWLRPADGEVVSPRPGQFFTVVWGRDAAPRKRAYSLSHTPREDGAIRLTIQRVEGGLVSTPLTESVGADDQLLLLGPSGSFGARLLDEAITRVAMIGGGSGVTPFGALCHSLLPQRPTLRAALLHGSRDRADAIFHDEFSALAGTHAGRFHVAHVFERDEDGVAAWEGRLSPEVLSSWWATLAKSLGGPPELIMVCGPPEMIARVEGALATLGVPPARIVTERFVSLAASPGDAVDATTAAASPEAQVDAQVHFRVHGQQRSVRLQAGQTLLEGGLEAGLDLPFSCGMGGCGACKVRVVEGEVTMESPNCLSEAERAAGDALACVGHAAGPCVVEVNA